ncbi:hypothetical protein WJX72_004298 [[Myrmecia] bisecta]|uniref:26S proteasome regulatory subunit RPN7 n=1 Tax=[Myrmecia] bisecta TaxID=41462 RepID=A0AAW1QBB1_9CHLO
MAEDQKEEVDQKIAVAHKRFLYKTQDLSAKEKAQLQQDILDAVFRDDAAPLYQQICSDLGWPVDTSKLEAMQKANAAALAEADERIKDAEENLGESEVREALLAKADYLCKIGDRTAAQEAYKVTEGKTAGVGLKMDLVFSLLRLDMASGDWHAVKRNILRAKLLCSEGGDWERKNRLKVYESLYLLATRDFKHAAELFLDSIATFTTTELFSYETSIFYTVVTALITLDRVALKSKVVDAPEILTVIDTIPNLGQFLNGFYDCKYHEFFEAFAAITEQIRGDPYLHPHFRYYVREIRVMAYSQFLESYKSVTLESMARAFGVNMDFMDQELCNFIVDGRLTAKIDKVSGIIETNRPDAKNAQYQQTLKHGDVLLNRLQKLAKVIDLE